MSESIFETQFPDYDSEFETDLVTERVIYPKPPWVDEVLAEAEGYADDAAESAAKIENLTVSSETLPEGSEASVTKTDEGDHYNLDFGLPKGDKGDVGPSNVYIGDETPPHGEEVWIDTTESTTFEFEVSAQTLPAGSDASVTKTETPTGINLEFGIPKGADGQVQDVKIDGNSIVDADHVASIPKAGGNVWGVFKPHSGNGARGLFANNDGVAVVNASNTEIDSRSTQYKPIVPTTLDYAVKRALTDGVGTAYTDAEQAAARARIGANVTDVQISNASIVTDGVADIPKATASTLGVVKTVSSAYGLSINDSGQIFVFGSSNAEIDARTNGYKAVTPATLDYAVKAAMTDGRGAAWSAAEQLAARTRIGVGNYTLVATYTLDTARGDIEYQLPQGYTDYKIQIKYPASGTSDYGVYYYFRGVDNAYLAWFSLNTISTTADGRTALRIYNDGGFLHMVGTSFKGTVSAGSSVWGSNILYNFNGEYGDLLYDPTEQYRIMLHTNSNVNLMPAGTETKIYAR